MATIIEANIRTEGWVAASRELLEGGPRLNLILSIAHPALCGIAGTIVTARINDFLRSEGQYPVHTVAETIFPGWEYRNRGLRGVFETYKDAYSILMKGQRFRWGTYAHRLVERTTTDGNIVNPLKTLIEKMKSEYGQTSRGTFRACYEVGIAEPEYDLPLYNTVKDQNLRRNLPCLAHLSFKLFEGNVHLTAMYRAHDYRHKALGNLLGLARLQACVAREVGVPLGTLVVHSTYAYLEGGKGIKPFRKLISDLREIGFAA